MGFFLKLFEFILNVGMAIGVVAILLVVILFGAVFVEAFLGDEKESHITVSTRRPTILGIPEDEDIPSISIENEKKKGPMRIGTAVAMGAARYWVTARHVVEGCRNISLAQGGRWRSARVKSMARGADIAVLEGGIQGKGILAVRPGATYRGMAGFHFGYPQGRLGQVSSILMGPVMARRGKEGEYGLMWAHRWRWPRDLTRYSGMSGGPVLDRNGRIVGINQASAIRRGRIVTSSRETVHDVLRRHGLYKSRRDSVYRVSIRNGGPGGGIPALGRALRRDGIVVLVRCIVR